MRRHHIACIHETLESSSIVSNGHATFKLDQITPKSTTSILENRCMNRAGELEWQPFPKNFEIEILSVDFKMPFFLPSVLCFVLPGTWRSHSHNVYPLLPLHSRWHPYPWRSEKIYIVISQGVDSSDVKNELIETSLDPDVLKHSCPENLKSVSAEDVSICEGTTTYICFPERAGFGVLWTGVFSK